ncbi:Ribonucleotide reductase transcriptional regulator NrdR [hydrothermal vent metagenome]|uniref:Ribonucleotide reductase transcriptional regulator NrdR n=1 Tax=hydrothermal vent metagenome TaxID=652676 RepID=A0A3B1DRP8_9ZZZZ
MKCPFCGNLDDRVIDSRMSKEGDLIRRRRECLGCERRFTSYERIEDVLPMVVKKDARREAFERYKILSGLKKACEKRPISTETLEGIVDGIEKKLLELGVKEIQSTWIGEEVMNALKELDKVAYVRFASVYRQFKDINELMDEVKSLFETKGKSDKN